MIHPSIMRWTHALSIAAIVGLTQRARAQEGEVSREEAYRPLVHLPLDVPFGSARENFGDTFWPSMHQSLQLTKTATYGLHAGVVEALSLLWDSSGWPAWAVAFENNVALVLLHGYLLSYLPLSTTWLHEEWHRAVMSRRGIDSYDGVYDFDIGASGVPVRAVRDEDLAALKSRYPAEMVRLSSAGIEADVAFSHQLDRDRFFEGTRAVTVGLQWLQTFNAVAYMYVGAYDSVDTTAEFAEEEARLADRDFTGLDPNGWVYDLHRPAEPYEARGIHPSGVGIDRYRTADDLTEAELRYLRRAAAWSLLNFVNPNLIGLYDFEIDAGGREPWRFNITLRNSMAPFGLWTSANLFLDTGRRQWLLQLQAYESDSLVLPGLSLELVREPLPVAFHARASLRVEGWLQPQDLLFAASASEPGAAASVLLSWPTFAGIEAYALLTGKTRGWLVGEVYLGSSIDAHVGLRTMVY